MPTAVLAGLWGLLGGSALLIGAGVGYFLRVPSRWVAAIMAFGSGVLISALAFELMDEAYARGGLLPAALGFLGGATLFTLANALLAAHGAKHRKRSGDKQPTQGEDAGSGLAIAVGSLLDGIPESVAIGLSLIHGGAVGFVTVTAVFLSNIPEGLSSSAGMRNAGRSRAYVFGIWGVIALLCGVSSWAGYAVFRHFSPAINATSMAVAAGAILAMLVDTMIPEAFEKAHNFAGLITVAGFLSAFALSKLGGK